MTTPTTTAPSTSRAVALAPTAPSQIASAGEMAEALAAVQAALAPDLNPHELKLFAMVAYRSGLDPFARQIHAVKRQGKVTFQTGIDGFRSTAERTGEYDGSDEPEFGPACSCSEQPKPHPEWARVTVYRIRNGERRPQSATAYWHEFKPAPGQSGNGDAMWKKMPRNQLAKCAEALAFRKAFPYVLADIYSPEEMAQADNGPRVIEHRPSAREAVAARRAEVEQEAVTGEDVRAEAEAVGDVDEPIAADFVAIEDEGVVDRSELIAKVLEAAAQSGMKGAVTEPQKARLVAAFGELDASAITAGVRAVFGHDDGRLHAAAEAQALITVADSLGDEDFQAQWAAIAAAEANE